MGVLSEGLKGARALLDMSRKARMERAREMGFDTERVLYHGTPDDWMSDPKRMAEGMRQHSDFGFQASSLTGERDIAGFYAGEAGDTGEFLVRGEFYDNLYGAYDAADEAGLPLDEWLRENGYAGIRTVENDEHLVLDPANIRSVNAAFDPSQRNSSNLLAGVGGAAVGAGLLAPQEADAAQAEPERAEYDPVDARQTARRRREIDELVDTMLEDFRRSAAAPRPETPRFETLAQLAEWARAQRTSGIPLYEQPLASTADTLDRLAYGDYRRGGEGLGTLAADAAFTAAEAFDPATWAALGRQKQQNLINRITSARERANR